ncbi:cytochrome c oxidase [Ceraceosorus guamensis]|nr:cytochrome c oxidase [Ceraceosorus guamensis]PWN45539.1 cytochrome c oxidase [Ceraceosorus guamensis]
MASHSHDDETFESFTARYTSFFDAVEDLFELQRGLNNCFSYDLVPAPEVIESALRASRRVNDFSTAVRVFEGLKEKVENEGQYQQYVTALADVRKELGINLREELYNN